MRLFWLFLFLFLMLLAALVLWPQVDLWAASLFFDATLGTFPVRDAAFAGFLHDAIQSGARAIGVILLLGLLVTVWRRRPVFGLTIKAWTFLFLSLVLLPGVLTNTILKDQWGRARPVQVAEFGGNAQFTPALFFADQCTKNCSFVSGDASLAFWLHVFGYVAPRARRRIFAAGIVAGLGAGLLRMAMGAHFLSDVLFAGFFMLAGAALLHFVFFGRTATLRAWGFDRLSR